MVIRILMFGVRDVEVVDFPHPCSVDESRQRARCRLRACDTLVIVREHIGAVGPVWLSAEFLRDGKNALEAMRNVAEQNRLRGLVGHARFSVSVCRMIMQGSRNHRVMDDRPCLRPHNSKRPHRKLPYQRAKLTFRQSLPLLHAEQKILPLHFAETAAASLPWFPLLMEFRWNRTCRVVRCHPCQPPVLHVETSSFLIHRKAHSGKPNCRPKHPIPTAAISFLSTMCSCVSSWS
jgi:hypothetical protein